MGFFPTIVGGLEVRERPKRYRGEPTYKRLDFVRPKDEKDDYQIVKTIYKQRGGAKEEKESEEIVQIEEEIPRLTFEQWRHASEHVRRLEHERMVREQQARIRAQEEHNLRMRIQQQQQQQQQHGLPPPPGPHAPGFQHAQHHPQQHPQHHPQHHGQHPGHPQAQHHGQHGVGFGQRPMLGNQQPPGIVEIVGESSDSSDEEIAYVQEIRPRNRRRQPSVIMVDDIYSSSSDDEPPRRRSRSGHRSRSRHSHYRR